MTRSLTRTTLIARGGLARNVLLVVLPLAVGPLMLAALLLFRQAQADRLDQIQAQLDSLATVKQAQIEQWAASRVKDLQNLASAPDIVAAARDLSAGASPSLQARLDAYVSDNPDYHSLYLAEAETGSVLAASSQGQAMLGQSLAGEPFYQAARFSPLFVPPHYDPRLNPEAVSLAAAAPVSAADAGTLAILVGVLRDARLLQIIAPAPGLGATGQVYAVSSDGFRLGRFITPQAVAGQDPRIRPQSEGLRRALQEQRSGSDFYTDPDGQPVIGRYSWLPGPQLALLVEQNTAEAYAPLAQTTFTLAVITAVALILSLSAGVFFTRWLVTPLRALTEGAVRIANGDLSARVDIRRDDEIGTLAETFNRMSDDLRVSYETLRTTAEARARQLAATADMSRAGAARLGLEPLLARVTDLIRERFGYDHVSIFLLDEEGRDAVLQEATGPIGAELKARGYRLSVGSTSMVGWVTATGSPRITADVSTDPVYRREDQLADIRSEATFPLRLGERTIGALDVQSRQPDAFSAADTEVLQILANQIAAAVENSRLFTRQQRLLQLEELVLSLTGKIHQTYNLDTILESAATELGRAFGARRAVVRLYPMPRLEPAAPQARSEPPRAGAAPPAEEAPAGPRDAQGQPL